MLRRTLTTAALAAAAVVGTLAAPAAQAGNVGWSVSIGAPGIGVTVGQPYGYGYAPAYYGPRAVYAPYRPYYGYRPYYPPVPYVAPVVVPAPYYAPRVAYVAPRPVPYRPYYYGYGR
jgi:hypothetical protein